MSVDKKQINDFMTERGGFTMTPNELWEVDLDHIAKVIWNYVFSRSSTWESSQNNIARNLKLHPNTVTKHVSELKKLNMLKTERGPNNATNYEIVPPNLWCAKIRAPLQEAHQTSPSCEPVPYELAHTQEEKKNQEENRLVGLKNNIQEGKTNNVLPENVTSRPESSPNSAAPTSRAILAQWKPTHKFMAKELTQLIADLFETLKTYHHPKDELSTDVILKTLFGTDPHRQIRFMVPIAKQTIDEQRELIYAPEFQMREASPRLTKSPGRVVEEEFDRFAYVMSKAKEKKHV
jgi:hypothetical protein